MVIHTLTGINMDYKFKFSIITAFYNTGEFLRESIESVINQDIGFKENVQLILVDDGSSDNSRDIALEYQKSYPENISVVSKENGGVATARNLGLEYVEGEYVNFLDSDDIFSPNALSVVADFLNRNDVSVACIPIRYFGKKEGEHHLNYKFETERVIDLTQEYNCTLFHVSSSFIKSEVIENYEFNPNLINGSDGLFINEILIDLKRFGVVNRTVYNYRKREDESSIIDKAPKSKRFFTEKMKLFYKHLIDLSIEKEGRVLEFIQYAIAIDLTGIIVSQNFEELITSRDEINEFWDCLNDILSYIDYDIIINHRYLREYFKSFFVYLKNNKEFNIGCRPKKRKVFLRTDEFIINKLHNHKINIKQLDVKDNNILICGSHVSSCRTDALTIHAIVNTHDGERKVIKAKKLDLEHKYHNGFLGIDWLYSYDFSLKIPFNDIDDFDFTIRLRYQEDDALVLMYPNLVFNEECDFEDGFRKFNNACLQLNDIEFYFRSCLIKDVEETSGIVKKVLGKSNSYKFYKDNYQSLVRANQDSRNEIKNLQWELKSQSREMKRINSKLDSINDEFYSLRYSLPKDVGRKYIYKKKMGKELNLDDPKDFNEKINWLIVNEYGENEAKYTDKRLVKELVAAYDIPDLHVAELYKTYRDVDEIDLDELPERFVLKCNHVSGRAFICTDKKTFDLDKAKQHLSKLLNLNYAVVGLEYHYKYIEPCIIAEEYLDDKEHERPLDYKFYCFAGKVDNILLCSERDTEVRLDDFDLDWNLRRYSFEEYLSDRSFEKPKNLKRMIEIAETLGKGHTFVRVDLYEINGKIYFGELTFTPGNGMITHYKQETLDLLGSKINLPK